VTTRHNGEITPKRGFARPAVFALFVLYLLAMLFVLIIPNPFRSHNVLVGGLTWEVWLGYVTDGFNLIPFREIAAQMRALFAGEDTARHAFYLVGNLVGFLPLGFFLPILFQRQQRYRIFIATVLLVLIGLELAQVLTMRGSFDIDDLILNSAGASLGFWAVNKATSGKQD